VTGGTRSGKSAFAERLAAGGPEPIVYLATALVADDEMRERVARHRATRPVAWRTLEVPTGLAAAVRSLTDTGGMLLLDDLGNLAANVMYAATGGAEPDADTSMRVDAALRTELDELEAARHRGGWGLVVVTNEVGLGLVPATAVGRVFRDALGRANQALASRADAAYVLVAGLPLRLKPTCPTCAPLP